MLNRLTFAFVLCALPGCSESITATDGSTLDGGALRDGSAIRDGGVLVRDGGPRDGGDFDAGPRTDGGDGTDAGPPDGGCCIRTPVHHRPTAGTCDPDRPRPDIEPPVDSDCTSHDDCTEGANGRCLPQRFGYFCTYDACFMDSECETGSVCLCREDPTGGSVHRCTTGNCQVDADCAAGFCSPTFGSCGNYTGTVGFYCHTEDDECIDDADCPGSGDPFGAYCAWNAIVAHWTCQDSHCAG